MLFVGDGLARHAGSIADAHALPNFGAFATESRCRFGGKRRILR
jgi:hypothetical protein